jgi:hypothetical protein
VVTGVEAAAGVIIPYSHNSPRRKICQHTPCTQRRSDSASFHVLACLRGSKRT